jgi:hypothetical protein
MNNSQIMSLHGACEMPPESLRTNTESPGLFLGAERLPGGREALPRLFKKGFPGNPLSLIIETV